MKYAISLLLALWGMVLTANASDTQRQHFDFAFKPGARIELCYDSPNDFSFAFDFYSQ